MEVQVHPDCPVDSCHSLLRPERHWLSLCVGVVVAQKVSVDIQVLKCHCHQLPVFFCIVIDGVQYLHVTSGSAGVLSASMHPAV